MNNTLFWFRNDLRLHDNEALSKASTYGAIVPVYIIDKRQFEKTHLGFRRTEKFRAKFLLESLSNLRENLKKIGSELIVKIGIPEEEIFALAQKYEVDRVVASKEVTQEETTIEALLSQKLKTKNIDIELYWGNTLIHARDLPFQIHFLPDIFTDFRKKVENYWIIRPCLDSPEKIRNPINLEIPTFPTLEDIGFDTFTMDNRDANNFRGGETYAFERLNSYFWETDSLKDYKITRNQMLGSDYSSKLSPWLSLGCISPRKVYEEIRKYEKDRIKNDSTYWLIFELLWRDYFHFIALKFGVRMFKRCGIKHDFTKKWKRNREHLNKWVNGQTGVPIVDACMIELKSTGYLSNRGRQIATSFFTKDLGLEWWWGAMYFEAILIDYEVCSNWGNWNYIAGIGTDPREDRYFNPVIQAQKYDADSKFIKTWIPDLELIEPKVLHEIIEVSNYLSPSSDYPLTPIVKSKKWSLG
jgi:deoxyribodipyrimidine photo-lyase